MRLEAKNGQKSITLRFFTFFAGKTAISGFVTHLWVFAGVLQFVVEAFVKKRFVRECLTSKEGSEKVCEGLSMRPPLSREPKDLLSVFGHI